MSATVEIRTSGGSLAGTMREMGMWLDYHKVIPQAFRQSIDLSRGIGLHIEFNVG